MHPPALKKFWPYGPAVTLWLLAAIVYALAGWGLARHLGVGDLFRPLLYSEAVRDVTFLLFTLFLGWRAARMVLRDRPARPIAALISDLRQIVFNRRMMVAALPVFAGFVLFIGTFTSLKTMIPLVQPYGWDAAFAAWDRAVHFGIDPWRILQPVLGHAPVTVAINVVYNLWFVVMFGVLYWQLFNVSRPELRMRFFWSFLLTWIVCGTVLAMAFSSVGPCFYANAVPDDASPFAAQMDYLRGLRDAGWPVWALSAQDMLWTSFQSSQTGIGSGISAMPSVHVALAFLFFLLSRSYGVWVRRLFTVFAIVIMLGSVHLAWHYAIDGYLGAIVAAMIWWLCGLFLKEEKKE